MFKIYKIINNVDDKIYIGSTTQPLYKRINDHRKRYRRPELTQYTSKILFDNYGIENCKIILIDEFEYVNKEHQNKIEREHIDMFKKVCVNKYMPFKTIDEIKQDRKMYSQTKYAKHKDTILAEKKKPYTCECGSVIHSGYKYRHFKSSKHLEYIKKE